MTYDKRDSSGALNATPVSQRSAGHPPKQNEPVVRLVKIRLCELCLAGVGEECHTQGCALWLHNSPGHPIHDAFYEVVREPEPQAANTVQGQNELSKVLDVALVKALRKAIKFIEDNDHETEFTIRELAAILTQAKQQQEESHGK